MAISESALRLKRPVHDITADVEHGLIGIRIPSGRDDDINRPTSFLVILLQVIVKRIVRTIGTIVETVTKSIRLDKIKYRTIARCRTKPQERQLGPETNRPISE